MTPLQRAVHRRVWIVLFPALVIAVGYAIKHGHRRATTPPAAAVLGNGR